jgi:hypothetical protein
MHAKHANMLIILSSLLLLVLYLQVLLVLILPLLFTLLGDTAELYFSPTMAVVAQSIPKMRPRFAGG